jgi:hypothetical protein
LLTLNYKEMKKNRFKSFMYVLGCFMIVSFLSSQNPVKAKKSEKPAWGCKYTNVYGDVCHNLLYGSIRNCVNTQDETTCAIPSYD